MAIKTEIIKATCKGLKFNDMPNQDYTLIAENRNYLLVAVSDGLGSSKNSLEGAKVACKVVLDYFKISTSNIEPIILCSAIASQWDAIIRNMPGEIKDYRTTNSFVMILKNEKKIIIGRLGDVMVAIRIDGIHVPITSSTKEFINETKCLGSDGSQQYEINFHSFQNSFEFLIATDGIGDEIVQDKLDPLFNYLKTKYAVIETKKRNYMLKKEIKQTLNDKNDDDKSLVFAWSN